MLAEEARSRSARIRREFVDAGAPAAEAAMVTHLHDLDGAIGLSNLARESRTKPTLLTEAFIDLGARLGLDWAQQTAAGMSPSDPWERLLVNGLARDFQHMRLDFLRRSTRRSRRSAARGRRRGPRPNPPPSPEFRATIARGRAAVPAALAMLAQIASQARNLLAR